MSHGIHFQALCSCSSMNEYHSNDCDYLPGMKMSKIEDNKFIELDPINHPAHYTMGKIEVIDFIEDQKLPYHLGNVVKYLCRAAHKGKELEDLKKAAWYLDRYIKQKSA